MNSFSQKLKDARNRQGLSIDEIAEKTKVRHHIIKAIEEGDFMAMPEVYMRAFIKTYASFLKIGENEIKYALDKIFLKTEQAQQAPTALQNADREPPPVRPAPVPAKEKAPVPPPSAPAKVNLPNQDEEKSKQKELRQQVKIEKAIEKQRLKEIKKEEKEKAKQQKEADKLKRTEQAKDSSTPKQRPLDQESLNNIFFGDKEKKKNRLKKVLKFASLGLVVIVLVFVVLVLFWTDSTAFLNKFLKEEDKIKVSGDTAQVVDNPVAKQKVVLIARAVDTTSFRVHVDSQTDESITLYPGKSKLWEANGKIDLSGVIVGTVEFTRNNELLQPFGQNGSVVRRITIYRDKVVSSSTVVEKDTIPFVTPESFIKED